MINWCPFFTVYILAITQVSNSDEDDWRVERQMPMQQIKAAFSFNLPPAKSQIFNYYFFRRKNGCLSTTAGVHGLPTFTQSFVNGQHTSPLLQESLFVGSQNTPGFVGVRQCSASGQQYSSLLSHVDLQATPLGFTQIFVSGQQTSPLEHVVGSEAHERFVGVRHCFASGQQYWVLLHTWWYEGHSPLGAQNDSPAHQSQSWWLWHWLCFVYKEHSPCACVSTMHTADKANAANKIESLFMSSMLALPRNEV